MADVDNWILRKIVYAIYGLFPGADLDVLGALHYVGIDLSFLPEVKTIEIGNLSTGQKILMIPLLLIPYFDLEWFKFLGMDPIRGGYTEDGEDMELDPAEFDRTAGGSTAASRNPRRPSAGGSEALSTAGGIVKKLALVAVPIAMIGIAFMMIGGSGYGSLVQGAVGNELAGVDFGSTFTMVEQGVQTLQCFGNAACMRQWRLNNTQRPGSEEVGQSYSLEVEDFSVNSGADLDVSGRRASYTLPVGFSLYNPRHGLKGIAARGTKYQVRVEDFGNQNDDAYCGTGWRTIGGEYASDIDGVEPGTIIPGGFATPVSGMDDLNLSSCGLLQPAAGLSRRVALDVKYNYSSQARLYFEAMSRENLRSLGERPEFKQSDTADTPVKSYINVESPVTFRQEGGERASRVFRVRLGMSTDRNDIKYRFDPEEFRLYDSSKTIDVDSADISDASATCDGLQKVEGKQDTYKLSETMINYTKRLYDRGEWFSSSSGMSPVSCSMAIEKDELPTVSPSGETLMMRIDANYTVKIEKSDNSFKAMNGRCGGGQYNCPLLVPNRTAQKNDHLYSKCTTENSVDAANGCDVREGDNWHIINQLNDDSVDEEVEQGEKAYSWPELSENLERRVTELTYGSFSNCWTGDANAGPQSSCWMNSSYTGAIGLSGVDGNDVRGYVKQYNGLGHFQGNEGLVIYTDEDNGEADTEAESAPGVLCRESGNLEEYRELYIDNNDVDDVLFFNPGVSKCKLEAELDNSLLDTYLEIGQYIGAFPTVKKVYEDTASDCSTVVVIENNQFACYD